MMNTQSTPVGGAGEDDPWEQLAENLFGIEYGKEHSAIKRDSDATEPVAPAPVQAEVAPVPETAFAEPEAIKFADQQAEAPAASPAPSAESQSRVVEVTAPPAATTPQDSYWDALANWNWDESDGRGRRHEPRRPETVAAEEPVKNEPAVAAPVPSRTAAPELIRRDERRGERGGRDESRGRPAADRPSTPKSDSALQPPTVAVPAARLPESEPDDDFGLGLVGAGSIQATTDEPPRFASPPASESDDSEFEDEEDLTVETETTEASAETSGDAPANEGDAPRKRRRRRRRRGRGRGGEVAEAETPAAGKAPAVGQVPGADWDEEDDTTQVMPTERPAASAPAARERPPRSDDERRPARHGDRDEARTRPAPASAAPDWDDDDFGSIADETATVSGATTPVADAGGDADDVDDESGESFVNYENVPTWEEAISYLLHPNQVQVESGPSGSASRGAPPADHPRQTRHIGGRKGRH